MAATRDSHTTSIETLRARGRSCVIRPHSNAAIVAAAVAAAVLDARSINPLQCKANYSAAPNKMKLVHWPLMGGLLHLVQR